MKAFAYFPYAVTTGVEDFQNGEISMRFKLIGGALDQCAGEGRPHPVQRVALDEDRGAWHQLEGYLDGEKLLDYTLAAPVSGKVGVWSKTDSISEIADYTVQAESAAAP